VNPRDCAIARGVAAAVFLKDPTMRGMLARTVATHLVMIVAAACGGPSAGKPDGAAQPPPEGQVCTRDAKVCPDGSTVGRTGPNCEFAACPAAPEPAAP
jgi:hypothetical protein